LGHGLSSKLCEELVPPFPAWHVGLGHGLSSKICEELVPPFPAWHVGLGHGLSSKLYVDSSTFSTFPPPPIIPNLTDWWKDFIAG
jgi:hypothetical protein